MPCMRHTRHTHQIADCNQDSKLMQRLKTHALRKSTCMLTKPPTQQAASSCPFTMAQTQWHSHNCGERRHHLHSPINISGNQTWDRTRTAHGLSCKLSHFLLTQHRALCVKAKYALDHQCLLTKEQPLSFAQPNCASRNERAEDRVRKLIHCSSLSTNAILG